MPSLGLETPVAPPAPAKRKMGKIETAGTAFMVLIVVALLSMVGNSAYTWLLARPPHH